MVNGEDRAPDGLSVHHEAHEAHEGRRREFDPASRVVVDSALTVHRALGPGLLESAYEHCLVRELADRGVSVKRQVAVPLFYKGASLDAGYRIDLVVEDQVVVEIKAVETLTRLHEAQILTYMRLAELKIGLLMNFNVTLLKSGLKRFVL